MKKKLFLVSVLLFAFVAVMAQGNWELKKNENGIAVYTRKAATGNLKELRVICELDATKAQLISTLQDIGNYNDWVYSNKKSEILKSLNPYKIIYYTESRLPWPIKDRDLIVQLDISSGAEILEIQAKSLPDYLPQNKKFVRVPYSLAKWKVTQVTENKLKVDYTFSVDPGGSIPSWLVNATMAIGPYNSFAKLRAVLKEKYHN
ncbi:MAG: START domain-containing protein [Bacteroidota bacterium]|nr:START domain-containing protein [Bacteroidota bacterium]